MLATKLNPTSKATHKPSLSTKKGWGWGSFWAQDVGNMLHELASERVGAQSTKMALKTI